MTWLAGQQLTWIIGAPLCGVAVLLPPLRGRGAALQRLAAAGFSAAPLLLSLALLPALRLSSAAVRFVERRDGLPSWGLSYHLGADGISLLLVLLTSLLAPLALLAARVSRPGEGKGILVSLLLLQATALGTFLARDLGLFFLFWEGTLLAALPLIGRRGEPGRGHALFRYLILGQGSSLLLLAAILCLFGFASRASGIPSFQAEALLAAPLPAALAGWTAAALAAACAARAPLFPLHTWLPDACCGPSSAGSALLAAVSLQTGAYGFLRLVLPLLARGGEGWGELLAALAVTSTITGALAAAVQWDLRRSAAYFCVGQAGCIVLGLLAFNAAGLGGGLLLALGQGTAIAAILFLGGSIARRRGTLLLADLAGLRQAAPRLAAALALALLAIAALPGLAGFTGQLLVLLGAFTSPVLAHARAYAALAAVGAILAAAAAMRLLGRVCLSDARGIREEAPRDLGPRETVLLLPLLALSLWIGLHPRPFLGLLEAPAAALLEQAEAVRAMTAAPAALAPGLRRERGDGRSGDPSRGRGAVSRREAGGDGGRADQVPGGAAGGTAASPPRRR